MFLATVAFTALVGVVWEVCEFAIDGMKSGSNMQRFNNSVTNEPFIGRRALQDTMIDLMMDTLGGIMAGLYFAYTNIKGKPLYKFFELKYVKTDNSITYHEDNNDNDKLERAKAEKKALKLHEKNVKRKNKMEHKQFVREQKLLKSQIKKQQKEANKLSKNTQLTNEDLDQ